MNVNILKTIKLPKKNYIFTFDEFTFDNVKSIPSVKSFVQWLEERKALRSPSFTLEDIERLMDSKINQVLLKGSINQ